MARAQPTAKAHERSPVIERIGLESLPDILHHLEEHADRNIILLSDLAQFGSAQQLSTDAVMLVAYRRAGRVVGAMGRPRARPGSSRGGGGKPVAAANTHTACRCIGALSAGSLSGRTPRLVPLCQTQPP